MAHAMGAVGALINRLMFLRGDIELLAGHIVAAGVVEVGEVRLIS